MYKKILNYLNKSVIIVIFFSISSFLIRLLPWHNTIFGFGKEIIFIQPDAFYHLRRATIWANNFPKMPTLDFYMAYPYGAECPWPPLYDWFIAAFSFVITLGNPTKQVLGLTTALLPPILAALCVFPVYKIVKLIWNNERLALFSAFFAVIMPGMLGYSHVGSGDHHIAETFLSLWFFYYAILAVKNIIHGESCIAPSVKAGIFITLGLLVWQGEVVFFTLFGFYIFFLCFLLYKEKLLIERLGKGILLMGAVATPTLTIVRFIVPRSTEQTLWDFGFFSYFQPFYIAFVVLALFIFAVLLKRSYNMKEFIRNFIIASAVSILLALIIPPLRENTIKGIKFLMKTDPWHASINEFQKTFDFSMFWPIENINIVLNYLYFFSYLFPIYYGIKSAFQFLKNREEKDAYVKLFFVFWGIGLGILGYYQKRWNNAYSPALAVGIAFFVDALYMKIKGGHGLFKEFIHWREKEKGERVGFFTKFLVFSEKFPLVVGLIFIWLFLAPYYFITKDLLGGGGLPISPDLYNSLVWMRNHLPPTSYLWNPVKQPEYGIMAPWDHGHYIQYIAEKPTIVNNFGHQLRGEGFKDAIYIWSVETEEELMNIFEKYNARFFLASNPIPYFDNPISSYLKPNFLEKYLGFEKGHFGGIIPVPKDDFFTLPLARLMEFDGSSTGFGPALKHFRLVFESENPDIMPYHFNEVKQYKLYEYVKAARVEIKTEPGALIYIKADFISNWDRPFSWEASAYADVNGNFTAFLPYATGEDNIFIKPMSPYIVTDGKRYVELVVTNEDVYKGKFLKVDISKGKLLPEEGKTMYRERLHSVIGNMPAKGYINIHKKADHD